MDAEEICRLREGDRMRHMRVIDLFAGIGGIRLAFENAGCVFLSEIDPSARETYAANFRDIPLGDIRNVKSSQSESS